MLALLLHRPDDNSGAADPGRQGAIHPAVPPAGWRRLHRCGAAGHGSGAVQPRPHPRQATAADLHSRHHPRLGASFPDLSIHCTDLSRCAHRCSKSLCCLGTSAACLLRGLRPHRTVRLNAVDRVVQRLCCRVTGDSVWRHWQRHPVSRHASVHQLAVCDRHRPAAQPDTGHCAVSRSRWEVGVEVCGCAVLARSCDPG
jgi:hypothetical protein